MAVYLHFLHDLIVHSWPNSTSHSVASIKRDDPIFLLLASEVRRVSRNPTLADRFREVINKAEGDVFRDFDLIQFVDRLRLRSLERFVLASSFVSIHKTRKELANQAASIIRQEFQSAILDLCRTPCFEDADLSLSQLAKITTNLTFGQSDALILDLQQRQALSLALQTKCGKDAVSSTLCRALAHTKFSHPSCQYV